MVSNSKKKWLSHERSRHDGHEGDVTRTATMSQKGLWEWEEGISNVKKKKHEMKRSVGRGGGIRTRTREQGHWHADGRERQ